MLALREVTLFVKEGGEVRPLLSDITAQFAGGHFAAVIGPSGCGKSTLLKLIAGIAPGEEEGEVEWRGRVLAGGEDFHPSEIGYVPQFGIAHEELTALENTFYAMRLRVGGKGADELEAGAQRALDEVGLLDFADQRAAVLSGGQKRRLALAMELVSAPKLLLADEVTSGLDPRAEDEIVRLLHGLSKRGGRLVLSVTHSLQHLELYDSVMVLVGGCLAYHGPPEFLCHYFRCENPGDLYDRLENRQPTEWAASWKKHRAAFAEALAGKSSAGISSLDFESEALDLPHPPSPSSAPEQAAEPARLPGAFSQFATLLARRLLIFSRDVPQLLMQAGLVFGFPLMVAIFAWNGLPAVRNLSMGLDLGMVEALRENMEFLLQGSRIGSLVSGIVMFQVILLTLMGANNSGREVAAEREIFEKEKLAGLRPGSYVASKIVFLSLLVLVQSLWMGLFVHFVCGFPGELAPQLLFLTLANAAMTAVCLAISSWMPTAEQSSLASIYLVGFQLPLSGAVLALPELLGQIVRPFVAAYWSWSGVLQTLQSERYYDIVQMVAQTALAPPALSLWVLLSHILIGCTVALLGCQQLRLR